MGEAEKEKELVSLALYLWSEDFASTVDFWVISPGKCVREGTA